MATNNKLFDNNALKAIQAAQRRKWTFIGLICGIIVVIIAAVIYHEIHAAQENKIAAEYTTIDEIYNQENLAYQQTIQAKKADKTQQGNQSESKTEPDYEKSMATMKDFALKYPESPYGWQAAIRSSTYFITKNKPEDALKELETVLPYTSRQDLVQIKIRTSLAGIYASQNNTAKAIEQLNIVENLPHNPLPNQSRFLKAQILIAAGNKEEAKRVLNQIISSPTQNDFASSQQANDLVHQAKIYLSKMGL